MNKNEDMINELNSENVQKNPRIKIVEGEEVVVDEEVTTIGCSDGIDTRIVLGHILQQGHLAPRLASILAVGGGHETVAGACQGLQSAIGQL